MQIGKLFFKCIEFLEPTDNGFHRIACMESMSVAKGESMKHLLLTALSFIRRLYCKETGEEATSHGYLPYKLSQLSIEVRIQKLLSTR